MSEQGTKVTVEREVVATALLHAIEDISEAEWCAGWMEDIEFMLWQDIQEDRKDRRQLKALSDACDGWWTWEKRGKDSGEVFVPMEEWAKRYAVWKDEQVRHIEENRRRCAAEGHSIDGIGPSIWGHCSCGERQTND